MSYPGATTFTTVNPEAYEVGSKSILVTRDPVYNHPAIQNGVIVGRQPPTYFPLSILMTVINPLLGPVALLFSFLSNRAFKAGDIKYANKWSQYAFLICMITIVASLVIYMAIGFSLSTIGLRGGHSY